MPDPMPDLMPEDLVPQVRSEESDLAGGPDAVGEGDAAPDARGMPLGEAQRVELTVGPVAHGGHCVARHHGRVVFVRHALPGERVVAEITEVHRDWLRADAVAVLSASP